MDIYSSFSLFLHKAYLNSHITESIEDSQPYDAPNDRVHRGTETDGSCKERGQRLMSERERERETERERDRERGGYLPFPPKMCMSVCSMVYMMKVLTCGRSPMVKITGRHRTMTTKQDRYLESMHRRIHLQHHSISEVTMK